MHRFVLGTLTMRLTLTPQGPWFVRGQTDTERFSDHRGRPASRDVLQPLLDGQGQPVLPASSLKGVLRSTAERILRTVQPVDWSLARAPFADDPFVHSNNMPYESYRRWLAGQPRAAIADSELAEWAKLQQPRVDIAPGHIYPLLSAASQLFGATVHAGLLTLEDAHIATQSTVRRSHVAIDRFTGGVGEGPFIEELAPAGAALTTKLCVTNFALWQIGLLALTLREISEGYGAVGGGTRKGQGQMQISVSNVEFCYPQATYDRDGGVISVQARLADERWRLISDMPHDVPPAVIAERDLALLPTIQPSQGQGWRSEGMVHLSVADTQVNDLFREAVRDAWVPWIRRMHEEQPV